MKLLSLVNSCILKFKIGKVSLPIFFSLLFLISCKEDKPTEINLFDGHRYVLLSGEKELTKKQIDVSISNELKTLFNKESLVLYKYVNHPNYETYLFIDLDSTIANKRIYKESKYLNKKVVFYQHMVDSTSEISSITLLKDDEYLSRFSEDSLSSKRFIIIPLNENE